MSTLMRPIALACLVQACAQENATSHFLAKRLEELDCHDVWQQCGGLGSDGTTCCKAGLSCKNVTEWYQQCRPDVEASNHTSKSKAAFTPSVRWQGTSKSLQLTCAGKSFDQCWQFYTKRDPTDGYVEYVSRAEANNLQMYKLLEDGSIYLGSRVGGSAPAKSIRLQSVHRFTSGHAFVIDIKHMPTGYGTWPAWWATGPDWPHNGEIDTIESVHTESSIYTTLHTSPGCFEHVPEVSKGGNCNSGDGCDGCGVTGPPKGGPVPANSAGEAFNSRGGGVFVTRWTDSSIDMWFFSRDAIPEELGTAGSEELPFSSWPKPYISFPLGGDCPSNHFNEMQMIINLDFCGTWAGNTFPAMNGFPGGLASCEGYVGNPSNKVALSEAYWIINSVRVFAV